MRDVLKRIGQWVINALGWNQLDFGGNIRSGSYRRYVRAGAPDEAEARAKIGIVKRVTLTDEDLARMSAAEAKRARKAARNRMLAARQNATE